MISKAKTTWKGNMKFDTEVNGHHFMIDADESYCGVSAVYRKAGINMTHEVRMV